MNVLIIRDIYDYDNFSVYTTENEINEQDLQMFVDKLRDTYNEFENEIDCSESEYINGELEKWHGLKCVAYNVVSY